MILFLYLLLLFDITKTISCKSDSKNRSARGLGIVGGDDVTISSAPFVASLQKRKNNMGMHICGAVVATKTFLLTAAHCITDHDKTNKDKPYRTSNPEDYFISAGSSHAERGKIRKVYRFFVHPEFNAKELSNDLGAIALMKDFVFNFKTQPARLPRGDARETAAQLNEMFLSKMECKSYGWGASNDKVHTSLRVVVLRLIDYSHCRNRLSKNHMGKINEDLQFCTMAAGDSPCQDDSGGPLVCNGLVWGLASWGEGCSQNPAIFSRADVGGRWLNEVVYVTPLGERKRPFRARASISASENVILMLILILFCV
ncbi:trypsin-2 [Halyomorpha halys]|uniref:trypsin-2 n=1 Tax=Halyomorpha halys TaxID=286706 RepID=UPI0006D504A5|nr:trypsin-2-like [Halyomorpha halys]